MAERLQGVVIENSDALKIIGQQDSPETLFYVDPPYPLETRNTHGKGYTHELVEEDHRRLASVLQEVRGMVVLSGYPCDLYDQDLYAGWHRIEREARADGASKRLEVLWINEAAMSKRWGLDI